MLEIFKKGLSQYQAEQDLESYLTHLQTDNLIDDSHKAKEKSQATIEDQGYSAIAYKMTDKKLKVIKIDKDTPLHEIIYSHRYDILNRHGFSEGARLLPEEEPFVEQARNKLIELMGTIEDRWKPKASYSDCPYIYFEDLEKKQKTEFYDMEEVDRRLIDLRIDEILKSML